MVATPIGNLEDTTFRAVKVLQSVDLIAAEDTRRTRILTARYQILTHITSYHKFNLKEKTSYLISLLKEGKDIALVSDSGMPGISDPGYQIIRASAEQDIKVEVIPGPCALINALVSSALPTDRFVFEGFLPKKKGKKTKALERLKAEDRTIIIYESPYRLVKTLEEIGRILGDREAAVCRELTKKFEEVQRGKVSEIMDRFKSKAPKGEFIIVVAGS